MANIELRKCDLSIKKLDNGEEVVQLRPSLAFDEGFIQEMRDQGVKDFIPYKRVDDQE